MVRVAQNGQRPGRSAVSGARRCAYNVVSRVFSEGAFADRAFRAEAERADLGPRERAFAQQLAYGTVQRRGTLDYLLSAIASRPIRLIDPALANTLRLGMFQLLYLDGVPDHAAVQQTVELAKQEPGRGHRFANAVMRRAAREAPGLVSELGLDSPAEAAVLHSHPEWLVRMWWDVLGRDETLALLERDNQPPESAVRTNGLVATRAEVATALDEVGVASRPAPDLPEGLVLETPFDVHGSELFERGLLMPQSRASMLVARVLAPGRDERVLDLCAAPGAKTTHLAALMGGSGQVVAVERHAGRAESLERHARRLGASTVEVVRGDARDLDAADSPAIGTEPFDRVLLDPPCSGLGTLQGRPDARWRKTPEQIDELAGLQRELLEAAAARVRPGGTLVYSTCTISPRENEERVSEFLVGHPDWSVDDLAAEHPEQRHPSAPPFLLVLPHRHGTDGFFIARLRRGRGG